MCLPEKEEEEEPAVREQPPPPQAEVKAPLEGKQASMHQQVEKSSDSGGAIDNMEIIPETPETDATFEERWDSKEDEVRGTPDAFR